MSETLLLEFGFGLIEVACYSTEGPDGVPNGVAFRMSDVPKEINESDPTVDGIALDEYGPILCMQFTRPDSVQVVINALNRVHDALLTAPSAQREETDGE